MPGLWMSPALSEVPVHCVASLNSNTWSGLQRMKGVRAPGKIAIELRWRLDTTLLSKCRTPKSLGSFEQIILTALLLVSDNAYGVTIREKGGRALASQKGFHWGGLCDAGSDGGKGLVSSWLSEPTPERGGRAKRCYRLEPPGRRALEEAAAPRVGSGKAPRRFGAVTG